MFGLDSLIQDRILTQDLDQLLGERSQYLHHDLTPGIILLGTAS